MWYNISMINTDDCWLYAKYTNKGYGQIYYQGKRHLVHRIMYENFAGAIPEGYQIDHLCRVPTCINPKHLEAVTPRENYLRGLSPAAQAARRKLCPKGHKYTAVNWGKRKRRCRTCDAQWQKDYQKRKRTIFMSD